MTSTRDISQSQQDQSNIFSEFNRSVSQPLLNEGTPKKQNFKHGNSFHQYSAINVSVDGSNIKNNENHSSNDINVDESAFKEQNSKAYQSLSRIRQSRLEQIKIKEMTDRAISLIENKDRNGLQKCLETNTKVSIKELIDHRGYTLLHMACFKNMDDIVQCLIDRALKTLTKEQLKEWINQKTEDDGFSALHFASFRGNLSNIQLLLANKANMHQENNYGINVMHVAAQGDQPLSLYFFKEKGMSLRVKDNRGSTPLHWSCYSKSEIALCYLLSWATHLDDQDIEGYTPLHLAVKSVETLRSTRPVRSLLIRGSSRDIKDTNGRKPIDLVELITNPDLQKELKSMLKQPSGCACFMIKTPLKLMLIDSIAWFAVDTIFFGLSLIFFIISFVADPGYLKKPKNVTFLTLLQSFDPVLLCPDCEVIRTKRSRHCSICNKCVERFDHHCPWVNNCVGTGNHHYFIMFLFCVSVTLILVIVNLSTNIQDWKNIEITQNSMFLIFPEEWYDKSMFIIGAIVNYFFSIFFVLPVCLLTFIHIRNFCMGRTTNERFARKQPTVVSESHTSSMLSVNTTEEIQEQARQRAGPCSCFSNCSSMCCDHDMPNQNQLYDEHINSLKAIGQVPTIYENTVENIQEEIPDKSWDKHELYLQINGSATTSSVHISD